VEVKVNSENGLPNSRVGGIDFLLERFFRSIFPIINKLTADDESINKKYRARTGDKNKAVRFE